MHFSRSGRMLGLGGAHCTPVCQTVHARVCIQCQESFTFHCLLLEAVRTGQIPTRSKSSEKGLGSYS